MGQAKWGQAGALARQLQKGKQIGHFNRGHPVFQPFRHKGSTCTADLGELAFLKGPLLTAHRNEPDFRIRLPQDHAGPAIAIPGGYHMRKESGIHGRVRVQDIVQQGLPAFAANFPMSKTVS